MGAKRAKQWLRSSSTVSSSSSGGLNGYSNVICAGTRPRPRDRTDRGMILPGHQPQVPTRAVLISAFGIAAVMALAVSQRTNELGIRMALGASRVSIVSMMVRHGLGLA